MNILPIIVFCILAIPSLCEDKNDTINPSVTTAHITPGNLGEIKIPDPNFDIDDYIDLTRKFSDKIEKKIEEEKLQIISLKRKEDAIKKQIEQLNLDLKKNKANQAERVDYIEKLKSLQDEYIPKNLDELKALIVYPKRSRELNKFS